VIGGFKIDARDTIIRKGVVPDRAVVGGHCVNTGRVTVRDSVVRYRDVG